MFPLLQAVEHATTMTKHDVFLRHFKVLMNSPMHGGILVNFISVSMHTFLNGGSVLN